MGVRQGILETRDFSSDPGTSWVITVPDGHTMASITAINVGLSIAGDLRVRPSIGGTPTTAVARAFVGDTTKSEVVDISNIGLSMSGGSLTTGLYGTMQMYNLNTLAPVTCFMEHFSAPYGHWSGIFQTVTSFSEIIITPVNGGNINAGIIYVELYKRANVVVLQDFTADPLLDWDIGGLKKNSGSAIVLSSYDLTVSLSTDVILAFVSADGVTFDSAASDYRRARVKDTIDLVEFAGAAYMSPAPGADNGLCALITGAPVKCRTLLHSTDIRIMANGANITMSNREQRQIEKAIRVAASTGGTTINGGTGYAVKYAL